MTVSALITLSLLPIAATTTKEPPAPQGVRIEVRKLFATAPSAVVGAFVVGLVNGPVIAITPVFGVSIGLSQDQAAALLFALPGRQPCDAMAARMALGSGGPALCDCGACCGNEPGLAPDPLGERAGREPADPVVLRGLGRACPVHLLRLRGPCLRYRGAGTDRLHRRHASVFLGCRRDRRAAVRRCGDGDDGAAGALHLRGLGLAGTCRLHRHADHPGAAHAGQGRLRGYRAHQLGFGGPDAIAPRSAPSRLSLTIGRGRGGGA